MNGNVFPGMNAWQKGLIIFVLLFGLIIVFSYIQSLKTDDSTTLEPYLEIADEGNLEEVFYPIEELPVEQGGLTAVQQQEAVVEKPEVPQLKKEKIESKSVEKPKVEKSKLDEPKKQRDKMYSVQIASFRDLKKAEKISAQLKSEGFSSRIVERDLGKKGRWHRILVGKFSSKSKATNQLKELKKKYKDAFLIIR